MSRPGARSSLDRHSIFLVLGLFFLSGASGLVYQVIWVRLLTRVFGSTTFAVSALLAAFMAGLGLGSALAARYLHRVRNPLRWFGALEIGVGLYALALHVLLPAGERVFTGLVALWELSSYGESALKVLLAFIVLLPPTTLMGASLPLLVRQTVRTASTVGLRAGSLYAINTFGAAVGCFAAGFFTIPLLGMERTTQLAALVNGLVGVGAIVLGWRLPPPEVEPEDDARRESTPRSHPELAWATAAFTVSGFAALGLEVVWTRLLTLVFKGYSYSFTSMLTVFLLGIALGSIALSSRADRTKDPGRLLGTLQIAIGLTVLASTALLTIADSSRTLLLYNLGYDFVGHSMTKFVIALAVLGVPTFLFGAQFPVVSRLATDAASSAGRRVGGLYSMNVLGSILGALAGGYLLIPVLGTQGTLRLLSGAMVVMGSALLLRDRGMPRGRRVVATATAVAAFALTIGLTPPDLSARLHADWLATGEVITHYEEGATATVMVGSHPGEHGRKRILVNGSSASNSSAYGLAVNRVQGALPFLFERMPRHVLAACFGTGITFGTLSQFAIEHMDGVDISPEVVRAAGEFRKQNYDVVDNPLVTIHIDDGRNFLLKSRKKYDVITMEPMPPALAGVSDMYTQNYYELCRSRLNPGGIVSQWVPLYFLTLDDVKMLYRTFAEAFPYVKVFYHNFDTFLVGSDEPLRLAPQAFFERVRSDRLRADLAAIELGEPAELYSTYLMGRDALLAFAGDATLVTDDRPLVEFTGPKAVDLGTTAANYLAVTSHAESVVPQLPGDVETTLRAELASRFQAQALEWESARFHAARRVATPPEGRRLLRIR